MPDTPLLFWGRLVCPLYPLRVSWERTHHQSYPLRDDAVPCQRGGRPVDRPLRVRRHHRRVGHLRQRVDGAVGPPGLEPDHVHSPLRWEVEAEVHRRPRTHDWMPEVGIVALVVALV